MSQWKVLDFLARENDGGVVLASSVAALAAVEHAAESLDLPRSAIDAATLAVLMPRVDPDSVRGTFDTEIFAVYQDIRPKGEHSTVALEAAAMHARAQGRDTLRRDVAIAVLAGEAAACAPTDRGTLAGTISFAADAEQDGSRAQMLAGLASRLRDQTDTDGDSGEPRVSYLISISIDVCDSTYAKSRMRARADSDDELAGWYQDFYRQFLYSELEFYESLLRASAGEVRWDWNRMFVVKGIGDEVWILYEVVPEDEWKISSLVALLLGSALHLASRTISWSWWSGKDEISDEDEGERRQYPFKVYADVVEGAFEVSQERRDFLTERISAILDPGADWPAKEFIELGNRLNLGALMKDSRRMISLVRTDYIGWEIDRFFRASKLAMPCIATIGQRLFDRIEGTSWEDAEPVPNTKLRRLVVECPLIPGGGSKRFDHSFLVLKQEMSEGELKGVGAPYRVYHIVRDIQLFGLHHNQVAERTMGRTLKYFTPDMVDAVRKQRRGVAPADDGE